MKSLFLYFTAAISAFSFFAQAGGTSPYVFMAFTNARVLQKGGGITEASMNYNTLTQEMLFMQGSEKMVLDQVDNIDTIYFGNRKFIPAGKVFYEKLTDTKVALYVQYLNKAMLRGRNADLEGQANNTITASQGIKNNSTSAAKYALNLGEGYALQPETEYWLQKGKSFYNATSLKKIIKVFPDKEQALNTYIKENNLDISKAADLSKLIVFCNK